MDQDKTLHFLARVRQMTNGEYVATCEELHGVASGETEDEAVERLRQAVAELLRAFPSEVEALSLKNPVATTRGERVLEVAAG